PVGFGMGLWIFGGFFEDIVQDVLIVIAEHVERAPSGVGGGNRMGLHPAAIGEFEKIIARRNGAIEIREVESMAGLRILRGGNKRSHEGIAAASGGREERLI